MQLFGTKGQKFLHCPGTKGQQDKLKIQQLVKIRDGTRDGMVPDFDSLPLPVPGDKTGQSRKGRSKTERNVLKQEKMVLNKEATLGWRQPTVASLVLNRKITFRKSGHFF